MTAESEKGISIPPSMEGPVTRPVYRIEVGPRFGLQESGERELLQTARDAGIGTLTKTRTLQLYFLQGALSFSEAERLAGELLVDRVTEQFRITSVTEMATNEIGRDGSTPGDAAPDHFVDVTLLPGVTDAAATNLRRAAHLLGMEGLEAAATGARYLLWGALDGPTLQQIATTLCANPVIQRYRIDAPIAPPFFPFAAEEDAVEVIPVCAASPAQLRAISAQRRLALDPVEMEAIQAYARAEGRDLTDVEVETLAQTWSEHCVHKTFRATINYEGPAGADPHGAPQKQTIPGLLRALIRAATETVNRPWVRSAFVDNAGIVAFDEQWDLAFKVETHNHPSALEPFGGANTGVGGVVRDVLGVSARPIANSDVLCFGPPDLPAAALPAGVLHPLRIASGVVHGIEDYGNKMGIPTVNGAILYDEGYTANPLVYCGCLGILPRGSHPTGPEAGDLIVALGGRTGRDGLRGATFSSMEMDATTGDVAGSAVQIGNPIQEKQVLEVVLRARDEQLYHSITDCGAGGFSSAIGEMGRHLGARVQLARAPLKYPGLRPWEIWLSEAQERMVLAVPPAHWPRLLAICAGQDVEAVALGEFEASGRLRVYAGERLVADLSLAFLHEGLPAQQREARWAPPPALTTGGSTPASAPDPAATLLALLAHPNIRSKEAVIRRYDHEVQGGTAIGPLVGADEHGPGDAAVLVPFETGAAPRAAGDPLPAVTLANGICPQFGALDPYAMAWAAVDEAVRNAVAVGGDPDRVALLDNFCWGNPALPDRLGSLVRATQGCFDAAVAYNAPFVSGKDSLNNEYTGADGQKHAIPGTLLISALAHVPDVAHTVTMDLKEEGNLLFVVGATGAEMGGAHAAQVAGVAGAPLPPQPLLDPLPRYRALHQAIGAGLVRACHDCSEGGLAVAVAEMALAGRRGARLHLAELPLTPAATATDDDNVLLFAESLGRLVVEVRPQDADAFAAALADVPHAQIGTVEGTRLHVQGRAAETLLDLALDALETAWRGAEMTSVTLAPTTTDEAAPLPAVHTRTQRPRVLILHANGTNRDREAALACHLAGGDPEIVHVNQLRRGERDLLDYQMLVLPGGFSYGDDLGAGRLWALDLEQRLGAMIHRFVDDGRPVLGICNGFQALVKAGLLPGGNGGGAARPLTLTHNASARFECRWVTLQPNPGSRSLFTAGLREPIYCPVAHGEGRLVVDNGATAAFLQREGLIALTYSASAAADVVPYPANPNGSVLDIAGISNAAGNVLGLMPHPEDHIFPWQHPQRHRGASGGRGLVLFANGLKHC